VSPRIVHYSDVENAFDRPERIGRLVGTIERVRERGGESGGGSGEESGNGTDALVVGTGDETAPGALALERRGRQALAFFERVAPDAETFGNHDFDFSLADTRAVVQESGVPWVSANVRCESGPFAGVDPARVVERGGDRVALVGVTGPDVSVPRAVDVTDPVEAVRAARAELDADWLVVLAHVGDAVARELARETAADAVLAGHVHDRTRERVAGTLLVRPGANGRVVWEVGLGEAVVAGDGGDGGGDRGDGGGDRGDGETDHAVTARAHEVPPGPLDAKTTERMREQLVETGLAEVVATVDAPVPRDRAACLRGECALANLATDALRWVADADVAHVDSRGLRDGPPIGPEVTDADLVGVAPFAAGVFVATLSTADLLALVGESVHPDGVDGRDGEVWTGQVAGLALRRDPDAGETKVFRAGRRLGVADDGGSVRVDERRELRLATNGYVVYTDEFETMRPADARELHGLQYDAFVAYARGVDEFAPGPDGRIGYVD